MSALPAFIRREIRRTEGNYACWCHASTWDFSRRDCHRVWRSRGQYLSHFDLDALISSIRDARSSSQVVDRASHARAQYTRVHSPRHVAFLSFLDFVESSSDQARLGFQRWGTLIRSLMASSEGARIYRAIAAAMIVNGTRERNFFLRDSRDCDGMGASNCRITLLKFDILYRFTWQWQEGVLQLLWSRTRFLILLRGEWHFVLLSGVSVHWEMSMWFSRESPGVYRMKASGPRNSRFHPENGAVADIVYPFIPRTIQLHRDWSRLTSSSKSPPRIYTLSPLMPMHLTVASLPDCVASHLLYTPSFIPSPMKNIRWYKVELLLLLANRWAPQTRS